MDIYKAVTIMLVEDDPGDQKLIKTSLKAQHITNTPTVVGSGEEALEYLRKTKTDGLPVPDLILLDLNMPGMGGREFLRIIKSNPDFEIIPVVILTTSDADRDILESFRLQAAGYIKKPVNLPEFLEVIQTLSDYWFTICKRAVHDPARQYSQSFAC
ncbi:MAG: Response regulator rcp1 [Planctomycetes bacterium ADurb.Bin401]|nr:MAG: Response regulator rcp1 [Planctomycetes bacterium ADurb.Bin401]